MNIKKTFYLISLVIIFSLLAAAQEDDKKNKVEIPPGMERKTIGNLDVVVPKGGKIRESNGVLFIEDASEYSARNFEDMEKRVDKIENDILKLKDEIKGIKETLKRIENYISIKKANVEQ